MCQSLYRVIFSILSVSFILYGCGRDNSGRQFPQAPTKDLLQVAATPAFRNIDAQSFQQAIWHYPADGGYHNIPIGEALAVQIAQAFPAHVEVNDLKLQNFETQCHEGGFLEEDILCEVQAHFAFRLYHRPKSIHLTLPDINFDDQATLEDKPVFEITHGRGNKFQQHVHIMLATLKNHFSMQLKPLLVESNKKQLF